MTSVDRAARGFVFFVILILLLVLPAMAADSLGGAGIGVMTFNMYPGTDAPSLLAATTLAELEAGVDAADAAIVSSQPHARVAVMAREIVAHAPDLVALQEADLIRIGPTTSPPTPASAVQVDFLRILLNDLERRGQPYHTLAILPGLDVQAPGSTGQDVRVTDRTVILARRGAGLRILDRSSADFGTNLQIPVPPALIPVIGQAVVTDTRGWAYVDVDLGGFQFRFVTTHLQQVLPPAFGSAAIQFAEANELLAAATDTDLPLIMTADFNVDADNSSGPSYPTYQLLLAGGAQGAFTDAWAQLHPANPGYTCCQAQDLLNPTSQLSERIDLVFYGGALQALTASLAGNRPGQRTPSGLWQSDHAALAATFASTDAAQAAPP